MNGATDTNEGVDTADTEDKADTNPDKSDVLNRARSQRKECVDQDNGNMQAARDDLIFLTGGENQWPEPALRIRKADETVILTINQMQTFLHQVTNDQRQNTPSIKVHPVDDFADPETAKTMQGLIRHIEYTSNADVCYDTAVNSAAAVGFGYWYLYTSYADPASFDQDIRFGRVRNALAVRTDPLSVEADGSDMRFAFIDHLMGRKDFKRQYPEASANTTGFIADGTSDYVGWLTAETVLVCDWYEIEHEAAEAVLLSNGESGWADKLLEMPEGVTVRKKEKRQRPKVMLRKITAVDVLEETEIKCKWIPVFPVYGDEIDVDGKVTRSGIIRNAKGPAQAYNVMMSAATQEVAMRARAPWVMAEGQEEGHEQEFAESAVRNLPYLRYKPVTLGDKLAPPPQRNAPADVPSGMIAMAMHAAENVKRATGLFSASLGERGSATSGRQELAQQREGDVANFHFYDGLLRTLRHCGRCLVDMIPHYYDTRRTIRILGENDEAQHVTINEPNTGQVKDEAGRIPDILNNMTAGKFDVTISSGPSYTTMRQEAAEFWANAMSAAKDPVMASVATYLAVANQDVKGQDEAKRLVKSTMQPAQVAALEEKDDQQQMVMTPRGPVPAQQAGAIIAQLEQGLQQATEELKKGEAAKQQAEALKQQALINEQALEPQKQKVALAQADADMAKAQAAIADAKAKEAQALVDLERAKCEATVLPQRLRIEAAQAQEKVVATDAANQKAMQNDELAARENESKLAAQIAKAVADAKPEMPKGMTIKSPISGQSYEVTLH